MRILRLIPLLLATCVAILLTTSPVRAQETCQPIEKTTTNGTTFVGEVCVDRQAGTVGVTGVATLPGGQQVDVQGEGTIVITRMDGNLYVTINGTVTVAVGTEIIVELPITATGSSVNQAVNNFVSKIARKVSTVTL
jgi:hypothetical protein